MLGDGGPRHQASRGRTRKGGADLDTARPAGHSCSLLVAASRDRADIASLHASLEHPLAISREGLPRPSRLQESMTMSDLRFVYFADPMCSWCYGFSPVITALAERFEGRMALQRGDGRPARRQHGADAHRGQGPTSARPGRGSTPPAASRSTSPSSSARRFVYDTEPACRAVVDGAAPAAAAGAALHGPHLRRPSMPRTAT